jgi:predicted amidophosphoribosyltransferase
MFLFDQFPLRNCQVCHRLIFTTDWLCKDCEIQLHKIYSNKKLIPPSSIFRQKDFYPLSCFYLWEWNSKSENYLSPFIQSLKGGFHKRAIQTWLEPWVSRSLIANSALDFSDALIVPAPAHSLGEKDHAWYLAQALSDRTGAPTLSFLARKFPETRQKFQSKLERQKLQLESLASPMILSELNQMQIHFVDDVVTTGGTAYAAWKAMGRPSKFYVWSLIYRSRLLLQPPIDITRQ